MLGVRLQERAPVSFRAFPYLVAEKRLVLRERQDIRQWYVDFCPLENQSTFGFQHAEALAEAPAYHVTPILLQDAVVFCQRPPRFQLDDVWWVEHHKSESVVWKRQAGEVRDLVRAYGDFFVATVSSDVREGFTSDVHKGGPWVFLVIPKHASATARIKHRGEA